MTDFNFMEQGKRMLILLVMLVMLSFDPLPMSGSSLFVQEAIVVYVIPPSARRSRRRPRFV